MNTQNQDLRIFELAKQLQCRDLDVDNGSGEAHEFVTGNHADEKTIEQLIATGNSEQKLFKRDGMARLLILMRRWLEFCSNLDLLHKIYIESFAICHNLVLKLSSIFILLGLVIYEGETLLEYGLVISTIH
ncbi:hypothetical protein J5N97_011859 [Dioscorea zingiberensis]|uniref:Uncharacterized protein n=1 Tax=Dioscorea zingiberensis TaxID=325984 RepID=A0A9D5D2W6_9LILI|nr:hypothetical protein J5N97_011859 [Dioscorea zingiberensis]